jgi:hypothetical protein
VAARRTNGKLAREETADYQVTPMPNGQNKELKGITGRYWHKGEYLDFQGEPVPEADSNPPPSAAWISVIDTLSLLAGRAVHLFLPGWAPARRSTP